MLWPLCTSVSAPISHNGDLCASLNATLVVLVVVVVVVINSVKIPKAFLITQRSATKLYVHIRAHTHHRSTTSHFSVILQLVSN